MAISSGQVAVGATAAAQVLVAAGSSTVNESTAGNKEPNRNVIVTSVGATVYVGGTTGVSTSTGFAIPTGTSVSIPFHIDEAICVVPNGATGATVSYLVTGS